MSKPSNEKLVASINESAQHIGAVTLTFLAVCVYIGIAIAATKDEVLLLGTNIGLPLFDVQIPLDKFYILAPALLAFLHLHLLLLQFLLVSKVVAFCRDDNPPEEETDLFFPSLPISILLGQRHPGMVRFLLWLLLFTTTILLPASLLIATQVRFLPHHSASITAWHKSLVLFDLALIWYFRLRMPTLPDFEGTTSPDGDSHNLPIADKASSQVTVSRYSKSPLEAQILKSLGWLTALLLTLIALLFSAFLGAPATGGKTSRFKLDRLTRYFSENLSLAGSNIAHVDPTEAKASSADSNASVQLTERNLRNADFTHANLIKADLRGADLTGAILDRAHLSFAKLSPFKGMDGMLDLLERNTSDETIDRERKQILNRRTRLQNAKLRGADLKSANLFMADLRDADLEGAQLDGADLRLADLRGANLRKASLKGALLSRSSLGLADLRESFLTGADLTKASLIGADLWRSTMHAVDFREADLRGAKFVEVKAIAADFSRSRVDGADFQNSWLNAGNGLPLQGVDLRGAHLAAVRSNQCTEDANSAMALVEASDLRFVDFSDTPEGWGPISTDLQQMIPSGEETGWKAMKERLTALIDNPPSLTGPPCLAPAEVATDDLLYDQSPLMDAPLQWPASAVTEQKYHETLAALLVDQACNDPDFSQVLLREVRKESVPWRRSLAIFIARRMAEQMQCPAFQFLTEEDKREIRETIDEDPFSTDDEP